MKAVGYVRVSTERQEISPDAQRHMLEQWAHACGAELVAVHQDRVSGALRGWVTELEGDVAVTRLELADRPGLRTAIEALRELGDDSCLVAVKRDRILRDLEGMRVVQRLIHPARVIATGFGIDESTTLGRFAVGIVDLMAEAERGQLRDRTEASLAQRRREGRRVGALRFGQAVDEDGLVIPNEDELAAVALMLELSRERGWGRRRIATELQRRHEESKRQRYVPRGEQWQPGTVGRVLARAKAADEEQRG